ncbi:NblA/ycf18 family protein [Synechococcus sp. H65.1]|uniref:NblA/ycf18 family protein n=1 Tax=unclassified Synechococcus TaxID=2626047 RepID=UPI0039C1BBCC
MEETPGLPLEQEFRQRAFEMLVARMSPEQAKDILVKLHKQMLLQEVTYRQLLRHFLNA